MLGKIEDGRKVGRQMMRWVGWNHQLSGHEFDQTPEDSEGQGSLTCCSSWGHEEYDLETEQQPQ